MKYKLIQLFSEKHISGISCDSRTVNVGDVFFALNGQTFNGNNFISHALAAGAKVIITDDASRQNDHVILVDDVIDALNIALDIMYPHLPRYLIGVTGTNGKTSVVTYVRQIIAALGKNCASIGTLGLEISNDIKLDDNFNVSGLTTANIVTLRQILHTLTSRGVDYVALEASSHGLDQMRLGNLKLSAAGFTSFSQDHLDYHFNMDDYLAAKLKLFTNHVANNGDIIINADMAQFLFIRQFLSQNNLNKITTIGKEGNLRILSHESTINHQIVNCIYLDKSYRIKTDIIGDFQIINLLIAALLVSKVGFDFSQVVQTLHLIKAPLGRLQKITNQSHNFQIFVDYAHTPDALGNALMTLRKLMTEGGKLHVVFGCGGDRDKLKRPIMGEVASKFADILIITDDNPRNEDPQVIRSEILATAKHAMEIPQRDVAIGYAISKLQVGDILLIAGKGHEDYQIIGSSKHAGVDDATIALAALP